MIAFTDIKSETAAKNLICFTLVFKSLGSIDRKSPYAVLENNIHLLPFGEFGGDPLWLTCNVRHLITLNQGEHFTIAGGR